MNRALHTYRSVNAVIKCIVLTDTEKYLSYNNLYKDLQLQSYKDNPAVQLF